MIKMIENFLGRPIDWFTSGLMAGVLLVSNYYSFNVGTDFGNDAGICLAAYTIMDIDPRDIDVCDPANPEDHPIKMAVRESYLYMMGDHVDQY